MSFLNYRISFLESTNFYSVKHFVLILFLTVADIPLSAQLIHSHNDYQQAQPLVNALKNKAYAIEADVYLSNRGLVVAHDKKDTAAAPALESLYLQPIIRLYKKYRGRISKHKNYAPVLMIDVKENGAAAIAALLQLIAAHPAVFDRSVNASAVQIVISGDRGEVANWLSYPASIFFDGRPTEVYDNATLQRVAFISASYSNYVSVQDSSSRIVELAKKVQSQHKLLRLWGTPDTAADWKRLQQLGVDIINTDKVRECREYFLKR